MTRGRPAEPDLRQIKLIISGLVVEARARGRGQREAERVVAAYLETSESTVRRAVRSMRGTEANTAAMNLDAATAGVSGVSRFKIIEAVKTRLAEIRTARRKGITEPT